MKQISRNTLVTVALAATAGGASTFFFVGTPKPKEVSKEEPKAVPVEVVAFKEVAPPPTLKVTCHGCNKNEQRAAEFFYDRGVKDKLALATVLGNIKQESNFHPNICEGGARVPYDQCHRGGYGLIQFTSASRYHGLGNFARKYGGSPSSLETQLRYIVNERQWQELFPHLTESGLTIEHYMRKSWYWLGWGIHGARTDYAYDYARRLEMP